MLVLPDGSQVGTLGGGCIEAEVKRRALRALNGGTGPEISTFLLDEISGWDDGLICGGRMTILLHPVSADDSGEVPTTTFYRKLLLQVERGGGFTEAVVIEPEAGLPIGDRYLFDSSGSPITCLAASPAWDTIQTALPPLSSQPQPVTVAGVAFLPTPPRVTLLIVGAGHVGQAVARFAAEVGFNVWVLDDRESYASRARFPAAERLLVGSIGSTLQEMTPTLTADTYALIVTRGHNHDEEALYHLGRSACGYVGMIGSKRKVRVIFDDLLAKGTGPEVLARVHSPVGFDIGSQTVNEIAISIVAELIAHRNLGSCTTRVPA
jgi:xanthine dehydrogenase accessory factor